MKIVKFFKYVLVISFLFTTINIYALENDSNDESTEFVESDDDTDNNENNSESSECTEDNDDSVSSECNEDKDVNTSKVCKNNYCYPIPNDDCYAFSYSKDTGPTCLRRTILHAEFLWFRAMEQGLEYALEQDKTTTGDVVETAFPLTNGNVISEQNSWRPGGRIGLGFYSCLEKWNFEAIWTYININNHSSKTKNPGVFLPLFLPPPISPNIQQAEAHWHGNFNTLDLLMGKPYHVSRYFISNPAFGLKLALIHQKYHVMYYPGGVRTNVFAKNNYRGIGLRGFYEGQFILKRGWSIYGKAAYSLLFGKFDVTQEGDEISATPTIWSTDYYTSKSFNDVQSNTELGFGICFNMYNSCSRLITFKLGYEIHQWLEQNQLRKFNDVNPTGSGPVSRGNLSFNGLMAEFLIEF